MIRPFTCVTMLLAAGAGLYLYQTKHRGQMLDRQVAQVERATEETRTRIGVLRAEFALLSDPSRLQELAAAHLPRLAPTQPGQFTVMAELANRLPPVGSRPAPAPVLEAPPPGPAALVAAAGAPGGAPPMVPAPAPLTAVAKGRVPAPSLASAVAPAPSVVPADAPATVVASAAPVVPTAKPPVPRRPKPTVVASAPAVPRRAMTGDPLITPAVSPAFAPPAATAAPVGSALGMARSLASVPAGAAYLPAGSYAR